jgi:hypothetical protein
MEGEAVRTSTKVRPWLLMLLLATALTLAPVSPLHATAQYGGTILYYDANWNQVGYWYKPCTGNSTRWGVVGVHVVIDDFYSCDCGCTPNGCIPTITHDAPVGQLPSPSLVCGVG